MSAGEQPGGAIPEPKAPNERGLILKLALGLLLVGMAFSRLFTAFQPDPALSAYNDGVKAYERKDYPAARQAFTTATDKDPTVVAGWMNLALTELDLNHPAEAERAARRAVELIAGGKAHGIPSGAAAKTMQAQAQAHLSLALSRQGKHPEALTAIRAALQSDPGNPKADTWKAVEAELQTRLRVQGAVDAAESAGAP